MLFSNEDFKIISNELLISSWYPESYRINGFYIIFTHVSIIDWFRKMRVCLCVYVSILKWWFNILLTETKSLSLNIDLWTYSRKPHVWDGANPLDRRLEFRFWTQLLYSFCDFEQSHSFLSLFIIESLENVYGISRYLKALKLPKCPGD